MADNSHLMTSYSQHSSSNLADQLYAQLVSANERVKQLELENQSLQGQIRQAQANETFAVTTAQQLSDIAVKLEKLENSIQTCYKTHESVKALNESLTTLKNKVNLIDGKLSSTSAFCKAQIQAFKVSNDQSIKALQDEEAEAKKRRGLLSAQTGQEWVTVLGFLYCVFSATKAALDFIFQVIDVETRSQALGGYLGGLVSAALLVWWAATQEFWKRT